MLTVDSGENDVIPVKTNYVSCKKYCDHSIWTLTISLVLQVPVYYSTEYLAILLALVCVYIYIYIYINERKIIEN